MLKFLIIVKMVNYNSLIITNKSMLKPIPIKDNIFTITNLILIKEINLYLLS